MKPAVIQGHTIYSYEDYAALPDNGKRHEILEGTLTVVPAPIPTHQSVVGELYAILKAHAEELDLGRIYVSPIDVVLTRSDVVQPDVIFIAKDRLDIVGTKFIDGAPDLAVEVISAGSRRLDLGKKKRIYEREGIRHYWTVDPAARTLTEWSLGEDGLYAESRIARGEESFRGELFPRLSIRLKKLWA